MKPRATRVLPTTLRSTSATTLIRFDVSDVFKLSFVFTLAELLKNHFLFNILLPGAVLWETIWRSRWVQMPSGGYDIASFFWPNCLLFLNVLVENILLLCICHHYLTGPWASPQCCRQALPSLPKVTCNLTPPITIITGASSLHVKAHHLWYPFAQSTAGSRCPGTTPRTSSASQTTLGSITVATTASSTLRLSPASIMR